jgi:hypothetical protein
MTGVPSDFYAWLYTDQTVIVRVVEQSLADGRVEVSADGPNALRGRHLFPSRAAAARFRDQLDRQLAAGGFAVIWQSADAISRRGPTARPGAGGQGSR